MLERGQNKTGGELSMAKPGMCAEVYVIRAGSRYTTDWGKHAEMNKENVHTKKDTKQLI